MRRKRLNALHLPVHRAYSVLTNESSPQSPFGKSGLKRTILELAHDERNVSHAETIETCWNEIGPFSAFAF